MQNNLAPICLFTYNRIAQTKKTVEALQKNFLAQDSCLFIFSDGAKKGQEQKIQKLRSYLATISGFKSIEIIESNENKGLAESVISGVSQIIKTHEKVIVLEDDLYTFPLFLTFMNQALVFYAEEKKVQSINGYSVKIKNVKNDVYFQTRSFPWGWGTWRDRWEGCIFDVDKLKDYIDRKDILYNFKNQCGEDIANMFIASILGRNNSWYVRWVFDHFIKNKFSLFPVKTLVKNVGYDSDATNCKTIKTYTEEPETDENKEFTFCELYEDSIIRKSFLKYFSFGYKLMFRLRLAFRKGGLMLLLREFKYKVYGS